MNVIQLISKFFFLSRARIEILQLQQIRKMWEDLTTQIRSLHTAVQDSRNSMQSSENDSNPNRDPIIPSVSHLMRLAISDSSPTESTPRTEETPPETGTNANLDNHYKKLVESMVNALFDDNKTKPSTSREDDALPSTSAEGASTSSSVPAESTEMDTTVAPTTVKNEVEEPQPGPSGLSNSGRTSRNSLSNREYLKFRIYKSLRDIIQRTKRRREMGTSTPSTSGNSFRQSRYFRIGDPASRSRFRSHRHGRHSIDSMSSRASSRALYRYCLLKVD